MKGFLGALITIPAFILIGCANNSKSDVLEFGETQIQLLSNDKVMACNKDEPESDLTCVQLAGANRAEKTGKIVAYGLMLDGAGWTQVDAPMEKYISADPLKTPSHISLIYKKWTSQNCTEQLELLPTKDAATSNTILVFSASATGCPN